MKEVIVGYPIENTVVSTKEHQALCYLMKVEKIFSKYERVFKMIALSEHMTSHFPHIFRPISDESYEIVSI